MNQCQFKNNGGIQCGHHRNSDFPIHFSQSLQTYLCQQHERIIIENHLEKFIRNKLKHQLPLYSPFSNNIRNRFISNIRQIPNEIPLEQCLFKLNIQQIYCLNHQSNYNLVIKLQIEENLETINGLIQQLAFINNQNFEIRIIFHSNGITLDLARERLREMNVIHYPRIPETETMNDNSQIISEVNYNIETPVRMNRRRLYNIISEFMGVNSNFQNVNQQIYINPNNELELINVTSCNICMENSNQKGFKLTCCNQDIQVCVQCIINDYITEECKTNSLYTIKDMNMFKKPRNCYFCRKSNIYQQLIKDNECQSKFLHTIREKISTDTFLRIQYHMDEVTRNVSQ